jgi:pyrroline-5-carboxylate reductase
MKIAIIGAGNMGGAIARALAPRLGDDLQLSVANPSTAKLERLKEVSTAITTTTDNVSAVAEADIIILAVKPWLLAKVIEQIKPRLVYRRNTIVSLAAGVSLDDLERFLMRGDEMPAIVRAIPDTAITVGHGMTFISARHASDAQLQKVDELFAAMGKVAVIEERLMGAATALSSCGIAYAFKYIQAAVQAGVEMGFRPAEALRYVNATVDGAVAMLEAYPEETPQQQIDRVTTPGGMTIRGINALEHAGFTSAVINGILTPLK